MRKSWISREEERLNSQEGFTRLELLVVVLVLGLLVLMRFAAIAHSADETKRAWCASNLRQFALALHIYAGEHSDALPSITVGGGNWALDIPWSVGSFVESTGSKWTVMYCPGTAPRFTEQINFELYNFNPNYFRVISYAHTFSGSPSVSATNWNSRLTPPNVQIGFNRYLTGLASQRVLLADATISSPGQSNESQRTNYNYTAICGGYAICHLSNHLDGRVPAGGNLAMLDGHAEWRRFWDMHPRTVGSTPVFWW